MNFLTWIADFLVFWWRSLTDQLDWAWYWCWKGSANSTIGWVSYKVLAFGLKNAPATFQHLMNLVVFGLKSFDLVVNSNTWHLHLYRIHASSERLAEARLTINLVNYDFAMAPVQSKVMAIADYPQPSTTKGLWRLGLVSYPRSFYTSFCSNTLNPKTVTLCFLSPRCSQLRQLSLVVWMSASFGLHEICCWQFKNTLKQW